VCVCVYIYIYIYASLCLVPISSSLSLPFSSEISSRLSTVEDGLSALPRLCAPGRKLPFARSPPHSPPIHPLECGNSLPGWIEYFLRFLRVVPRVSVANDGRQGRQESFARETENQTRVVAGVAWSVGWSVGRLVGRSVGRLARVLARSLACLCVYDGLGPNLLNCTRM